MSADESRHKPSTKHTLEEVLQALQDLVRNELADADPTPPAERTRRPPRDVPAATPPPPPVTEPPSVAAPGTGNVPAIPSAPPILTRVVVPGPGVTGTKRHAAGKSARRAPEQTTINWDDIPILEDAVQPPPVSATPDPIEAIATAAVARVVADLRKSGHLPLDPAIIERLETALRQALKELLTQSPTTQRR